MAPAERVTITLPPDVVREIDRVERNRSKFIQVAVHHELERRRREDLRRSLDNPHAESLEMAEAGLAEWVAQLPREDASGLVDSKSGTPVRWSQRKGWVEVKK